MKTKKELLEKEWECYVVSVEAKECKRKKQPSGVEAKEEEQETLGRGSDRRWRPRRTGARGGRGSEGR